MDHSLSNDGNDMRVIKRDGHSEEVEFDKVLARIRAAANNPTKLAVNPTLVAQKVLANIFDGVKTSELDELSALICTNLIFTHHLDYSALAGRIIVSNHQKNTQHTFVEVLRVLYAYHDIAGDHSPIISKSLLEWATIYASDIESHINYDRDFLLDFFGFKTLEKSYFLRYKDYSVRRDETAPVIIVERPQHMYMREAFGVHLVEYAIASEVELSGRAAAIEHVVAQVFATYDALSTKQYTHATPTMFNAGAPRPQMSSCYLIAMQADSIDGIYDTLKETAQVSKYAGGIGLHIHNVRASNSLIRGTNGTSNGIVPMLRVFNNSSRYIDQGGKRPGSVAVYVEPWHADIFDFLELKLNGGKEERRAIDLFYALWIPDIFMRRLAEATACEERGESADGVLWTLMCPDACRGLSDVWGPKFDALYERYETEGRGRRSVPITTLWREIIKSQIETGVPYMCYKDAANSKSNQQNLGTIKSSNLCTEIMEYSSSTETAVCNLASIPLNMYLTFDPVTGRANGYDFAKLRAVIPMIVRNLDQVIDVNYYPTENTRRSNMRHRPIGIGVQGLADTFAQLRMPFDSPEARDLNLRIFAHMYYAAVAASVQLAKEKGSYETFAGSPASEGRLQPDLWGVTPLEDPALDWVALRASVVTYGMRNSLLMAPMPTASTAQILGNNEAFEPFTTNLYTRRTSSGEYIIVNRYLVRDLMAEGLWTTEVRQQIKAAQGSVQHIACIPDHIKAVYKTVWELKMRVIIDMSADRGAYICQSQSLNMFLSNPNVNTMTAMHLYSWRSGLKTGSYYVRTRALTEAQQVSVEPVRAIGSNKHGSEHDEDEDHNNDHDDNEDQSDDEDQSDGASVGKDHATKDISGGNSMYHTISPAGIERHNAQVREEARLEREKIRAAIRNGNELEDDGKTCINCGS